MKYFANEGEDRLLREPARKSPPKLLGLKQSRTLPEEKRKAVFLYYFEGMNDTEIAELFRYVEKHDTVSGGQALLSC